MYIKSLTPTELYSWFTEFDDLLNDYKHLDVKINAGCGSVLNTPAANIFYNKEEGAYNLIIMAPGFSRSDFNISVSGKYVNVKATLTSPESDGTSKWIEAIKPEFKVQSFDRRFRFTHELDPVGVKAKYADGFLNIMLPIKNVKIDDHLINVE